MLSTGLRYAIYHSCCICKWAETLQCHFIFLQAGWQKWSREHPDWYARRSTSTHPDWYNRERDTIRRGKGRVILSDEPTVSTHIHTYIIILLSGSVYTYSHIHYHSINMHGELFLTYIPTMPIEVFKELLKH